MGLEAGFLLGLLGSLHCVGMCGPLALAIHGRSGVSGRVAYNLGRVTTYVALGLVFGLLGGAARMAGIQEAASIFTGVVLLAWVLMPGRIKRRLGQTPAMAAGGAQLRRLISPLLRKDATASQFAAGVLNGLLPCGFVYVGLAAALAQSTIAGSAVFMGLFGLGTFPAMIAVTFAPSVFSQKARISLRRFLPAGTAAIALLLILRGLALGVPYLSPRLPQSLHSSDPAPICYPK